MYLRMLTSHVEKYLKKFSGRNDVEDAFQRLDRLTPEEALMAAAETMTITRDIDDTVKDVVKSLGGIDESVHIVDGRLKGVDHIVKDVNHIVKEVDHGVKVVDHKVASVINGELFFHYPVPESVLNLLLP